jgi:hypothetical protein
VNIKEREKFCKKSYKLLDIYSFCAKLIEMLDIYQTEPAAMKRPDWLTPTGLAGLQVGKGASHRDNAGRF